MAQFPKRPMVVLTGGDPLKRHDLMELIAHGRSVGLEMALTPSATPLATKEAFARVREAGIKRLGISLDGPNAQVHDYFRGWEGSFQRTREMLLAARELGMAVQVNTSVCRRNVDLLDEMAEFLTPLGIAMWALFFLVPVGRGVEEERIKPEEYELVFEKLFHWSKTKPYAVKTTEAPHYRRFVMERGGNPLAGPHGGDSSERRGHRAPLGVTDGKGIMFVSNTGEILPAGFLPIGCGKFPHGQRGRSLPEAPGLSQSPQAQRVQRQVRRLRIQHDLRRQPFPRLRRDRRSAGIRARLPPRAGETPRSAAGLGNAQQQLVGWTLVRLSGLKPDLLRNRETTSRQSLKETAEHVISNNSSTCT